MNDILFFRGPYFFLSNFSSSPILVDTFLFPTVEHAFAAAKTLNKTDKLAISQLKNANRWFYLYHLTIILSAGPTYLYGIYQQFPLKDIFYHVPNDVLYGKLIEGVGGGTWYGKDSLFFIQLMDNKIWSSFLLCVSIIILFLVWKVSQKKFY